MSLSGHFSSKHVQEDREARKELKQVRFFEDFPVAVRREADGTEIKVKGGKIVSREPSAHVRESKYIAKADVPTPETKFYKATPVTTLLEKTQQGEKSGASDTAGEAETASRVRKKFDVNARAMKL